MRMDPRVIEFLQIAPDIPGSEKIQETAGPEIRLVVTERQRDLFGDQDDADCCQHTLDDGGRKITGDHSQFTYTQQHLEGAGDDHGQQKNPVVA